MPDPQPTPPQPKTPEKPVRPDPSEPERRGRTPDPNERPRIVPLSPERRDA
jgi:hypothetical protein